MMRYEKMLGFKAYIDEVNRGGPVEDDYQDLTQWIYKAYEEGIEEHDIKNIFPKCFWEDDPGMPKSLLYRIFNAPGRIVGTYDILQDVHSNYVSPLLSELEQRWDRYIQSQVSAVAVRHRPKEFLDTLVGFDAVSVLDVACGSGVMAGACTTGLSPQKFFRYVGVDSDTAAIRYCEHEYTPSFPENHDYQFLNQSFQRLQPLGLFDVVWCSGLFDYLTDSEFIWVAKMLLDRAIMEVVIGNMGPSSPSIPMMDMFGWRLRYRSKPRLETLAHAIVGISDISYHVTSDPTGVQHYLHFAKP